MFLRVRSVATRSLIPLFLALLVVGCGGAPTASRTPTKTALVSPTATLTPTATPPPYRAPLSIAQAWGAPTVRSFSSRQPSAYQFFVADNGTPDGRYLVGMLQPLDFAKPTALPSYVALYDLTNGQVTKIQRLRATTSQVYAAASDDRWTVWEEFADPSLITDWELWAYDRQTGQTALIERQPRNSQGQLITVPDPSFALDHGTLVWDDSDGTPMVPNSTANAIIKERVMATGVVTVLAHDAFHPRLSWPWLNWSHPIDQTSGTFVFTNLVTGRTISVPIAGAAEVATSGTSVAYTSLDSKTVLLIPDVTTSQTPQAIIQTGQSGEYYTNLHLSDRLITWTAYLSATVWDRALACFVTLPTVNRTVQVPISLDGPFLVWYDNATPYVTYSIIDARTLPTSRP